VVLGRTSCSLVGMGTRFFFFFFSPVDIALVFIDEVGWVNMELDGVNRREFYFVLEIVILVD
jgi:hypothetical protein